MDSIYNDDDLRCNAVGLALKYEGEEFFKEILKKYPTYNPREIVGLFAGNFSLMADRRILEVRRENELKKQTENK